MRTLITRAGTPRALALLGLLAVHCTGLTGPPEPPAPEPAFVWGVCNPVDAREVADLSGGRPLLVRLDSPFTGGAPTLRSARTLRDFSVNPHIRFMIVLPYRPDGGASPDQWGAFVKRAVQYYGRQPQVRYLQITQGINSPTYLDFAGDRAPFARQALVEGLRAAREAQAEAGGHLRIGFSMHVSSAATPAELMQWLARVPDLPALVDWVGIDCYPGSSLLTFESDAGDTLAGVLRRARDEWLPMAGLEDKPLFLTQLGVTTVLQVSPAAQGRWVRALSTAAWNVRDDVDLRGCCWFETRDKDSNAAVWHGPTRYLAGHFGLSTDAGWRKEGFAAYQERIAALQPPQAPDAVID